ncbi:hypothetical protein J0910_26215 [Nocardiopsis sp. CNT-189]|uniref:DALR anticodon-binding domain-containing protein n=1 Tax=Nocardiopsis oceanisediminis TaxID=2816862 RepID=UPI003B2E8C9F
MPRSAATPWGIDALLRAAAAEALGAAPAALPWTDPRRVPGRPGRFASAVALRAGAPGGADAAAARIAAALRALPGVAAAEAPGRGMVALEPRPEALAALVPAAWNGAAYLTGGARRALPAEGEDGWARSDLAAAPSLGRARALAREDARRRIALAARAAEGAPGPRPEPAPPRPAEADWREPCADLPPAGGEAARLLAAVGESAARIAFCRAASEEPRPGEVTGPDLPAEPGPAAPGAWARYTWDNPAFAVRYAHAHAVAARGWAEQAEQARTGTRPAPGPDWRAPLGEHAADLVGALFDGPGAVSAAGRRGQPHMLVRYLEGLAASYHGWARSSDAVRGPAADAVALCSAASGVLGAGLALLGASAPTRP